MADVSGLPGSYDRFKGARRAGLIAGAVAAVALTGCATAGSGDDHVPLITVSQERLEVNSHAYAAFRDRAIVAAPPAPSQLSIAVVRAYTDANTGTGLVFRLGERNLGLADYRSVIALDPNALSIATVNDHIDHLVTPPLWQVPILLKDNIETADQATTAGSLALAENAPDRDAPLVSRLRGAGAIILGKANLSEWANIRSSNSISGWSAVGGQTLNPYDPARTPCGSSSGSAVAVAIGLAPAAIGTETDGSITCPASVSGVVGFKPTVGLVSRTHIVPISHSQDTAGPITTTVEDAAIVLTAIAGSDPLDPATAEADARRVDYRAALDANSLQGARLGVMRFLISNYSAEAQAEFERALVNLRAAGAEIVEITEPPAEFRQIGGWELTVLLTELKRDLNLYLASTDPAQVRTRTLADVIAFNAAEPRETVLFGQDLFERAEATGGLDDPAYVEARARSFQASGPDGIDRMMADNSVVALIAPTTSRAWTNDPDDDDRSQGSASRLAAVAGYPHLTVPMGFDRGMPVGISFIGGKWDDARILSLGHAYEQRTRERRPPTLVQPSS
ncbi:amidase [Brevundimonas sp. UBA2416]|uniref:amidase n=1 Tax=Brevundimonas sp. UBA2416 TaxID=1946124 RepID=UPI0025C15E37|nr:amidase [Brevundimonas sp. UBA2416]HRJ62791.1 amidase [Brevundimonas sp.]